MDASTGDDRAVRGIAQAAEGGDFGRDFECQREYPEGRLHPQVLEEGLKRCLKPEPPVARQYGNFDEAHRADGNGLAALCHTVQDSQLFATEPSHLKQPPNEHVSVEQEAQRHCDRLLRDNVPNGWVAVYDIPNDASLLGPAICWRLEGFPLNRRHDGDGVATFRYRDGFPMLFDFIEQCEALGFKFSGTDDSRNHVNRYSIKQSGHLTSCGLIAARWNALSRPMLH